MKWFCCNGKRSGTFVVIKLQKSICCGMVNCVHLARNVAFFAFRMQNCILTALFVCGAR